MLAAVALSGGSAQDRAAATLSCSPALGVANQAALSRHSRPVSASRASRAVGAGDQRQPGAHGGAGRGLPRRSAGPGARRAGSLVLGVGGVAFVVQRAACWAGFDHLEGIAFTLVALVLRLVIGTILFKRFAPERRGFGSATACRASRPASRCCPSPSRSRASRATSCRPGGLPPPMAFPGAAGLGVRRPGRGRVPAARAVRARRRRARTTSRCRRSACSSAGCCWASTSSTRTSPASSRWRSASGS